MPEPSVGRIVHYRSWGTPPREDGTQAFTPECRAAIISGVNRPENTVDITVFNPTGLFFNRNVEYDEGKSGGTYHWPEIV